MNINQGREMRKTMLTLTGALLGLALTAGSAHSEKHARQHIPQF